MSSLALSSVDLDRVYQSVGVKRWEGLRNARLFLTGGTGFVGKWLLATLLDASTRLDLRCQIVVLTREPESFRETFPALAHSPGVTLLRGDVRSFDVPAGPFSHVVHAATDVALAASALETFDTCVSGTRRVSDLALHSGAKRFLLISSGAAYGRQPTDMAAIPEWYTGGPDPLLSGTAYGAGKRAAEWLAHSHGITRGLHVTTARCFAFVGPYLPLDKHFAIGNFLRDALANQPIVIEGDGTPVRSYLYAADMAAWLWAALLSGRAQCAYNVGGGEAVSIAQLAQSVVTVLGSKSEIRVVKTAMLGAAAERYVPDVSLIRRELQLPLHLTLEEALLRTALWYQQLGSRT